MRLPIVAFLLSATLAGCTGPMQTPAERSAEGKALQRWAATYDNSAGLFTDTVGIDEDGTTFTFTATGRWGELSDDEQEMVLTNAMNAVDEAWCFQDDHRKLLIPGLEAKIVDDQGNMLKWKIVGPDTGCPPI